MVPFLGTTSSSRSDDVTLYACILVCMLVVLFLVATSSSKSDNVTLCVCVLCVCVALVLVCAICNMQFATCNVQHAIGNMQFATCTLSSFWTALSLVDFIKIWYRVSKKTPHFGSSPTGSVESWDVSQMKGDIHTYVLSASNFLCYSREQRYRQNNTGY